ncbi:hypothetical protein SDC9_190123 [bioreactor metagenome]|uniref:Uncharacterized protein n=1 Tax=bioreactor metagenome TaxID=1076179 RepID=A0A645HVG6_9ZZZZ
MRESVLALFRFVAQSHAARLEILAIRHARDFEVSPLPWRPDLNIKGLCTGESHVSGAKKHHAVMQPQALQNALSIGQHGLLLRVTILRLHDLDQFHFVELMDTDHAASAHAGCTGFTPEARRVGAIANG